MLDCVPRQHIITQWSHIMSLTLICLGITSALQPVSQTFISTMCERLSRCVCNPQCLSLTCIHCSPLETSSCQRVPYCLCNPSCLEVCQFSRVLLCFAVCLFPDCEEEIKKTWPFLNWRFCAGNFGLQLICLKWHVAGYWCYTVSIWGCTYCTVCGKVRRASLPTFYVYMPVLNDVLYVK